MMWGYIRASWDRRPQYGDAAFRDFLHQYQWSCLLRGKTAATERLNRRQSTIWNRRCRVQDAARESLPNTVN
jgi:biofilm PGA synthesis N-glycosyltransferase PgaC